MSLFNLQLSVHRKSKTPTSLAAPRGFYSRQRPSLPHSRPRSTIGPERLNFRVRDGNGCGPLGRVTGKLGFYLKLEIRSFFISLMKKSRNLGICNFKYFGSLTTQY